MRDGLHRSQKVELQPHPPGPAPSIVQDALTKRMHAVEDGGRIQARKRKKGAHEQQAAYPAGKQPGHGTGKRRAACVS